MRSGTELNHYALFADIFRYPETRIEPALDQLVPVVRGKMPQKCPLVENAIKSLQQISLGDQQEYYLKTFDVQAVCCLYIGYLLFGEDYKRAQLLVNLSHDHKAAGVDCNGELADHLPNILVLLSKTRDQALAEELGYILLIPALKFMLLKMKHISNYYKSFLEILLEFLQRDFKGEGLEKYAIPEDLISEKNEFLFPSPGDILCDRGCHPKIRNHVE